MDTSLFLPLLGHRDLDEPMAYRDGRPISVAQYLADVDRLAAQLEADCAAARAGRGAAGAADHRGAGERFLLNGCGDRYQFAVGFGAALIGGWTSVLPHNHVAHTLARLADDYPGLHALIDRDEPPEAMTYTRCDAAHAPVDQTRAIPAFDPVRACAILFTSGSSGLPVAQPRSWGTIVASARAGARGLGVDDGRRWTVLATVPAQHSYGFESALWLPLITGGAICAERPFYPADVAAALHALPVPRMLVSAPVHLRALVGSDLAIAHADIVLSATAPLATELARAIESRLASRTLEIYGSTETGQVAWRHTVATDVWSAFGSVIVTVTADDSAWASGDYVGPPTRLADRLESIDPQHFRLLGRGTDLINVGGRRNSVAFIEQQLLAIDGVRDAAILARDDRDDPRARLAGFVVAPGHDNGELLKRLRDSVDAVFLPRPLHRVQRLPRDGNGKLPRQRLLELACALADNGTLTFDAPGPGAMYDGHFPGRPMLPGARLLDLIVQALRRVETTRRDACDDAIALAARGPLETSLPVVKFLQPVAPAATLALRWRRGPQATYAFDCARESDRVASGSVRFA